MDCTDYRMMVTMREDGELGPDRLAMLDAHLSVCGACRVFEAAVRETTALHASLVEMAPPPSILEGVIAEVGRPARAGLFAGWRRFAVPAAAIFVLVAGVIAGGQIGRTTLGADGDADASFGLEYLEEYPPGSVGDLVVSYLEGGETDE
ncbi:MAG: zf-HC2 domain-containing protein [Candidatus Krumholzibacteriota bacterium]|nr:zf-HC2 domain-containing protein [Candidatus Krumholzibacteriota bacterium]